MFSSRMAAEDAPVAGRRAAGGEQFDILLEPGSHPELGGIPIGENLFAIGRTEAPFDGYPPELVADMSRRHARIFCERGAVYIADLGSKNGTSVNGVDISQRTQRLQDGDEVAFAGVLSYRVRLGARPRAPGRTERLLSLTLTPERADLGLQPIVVTQFPFLVSKTDASFARYRTDYPHQVDYLSRRHAHLFVKGASPFVEDLGSTNGTFLNGKRLDEHAAALKDDDVIAFGGHHFVYRISLQREEAAPEPTLTKYGPIPSGAAKEVEVDKTTFVVAPDSFLDIFCVDPVPPQEDRPNVSAPVEGDGRKEAEKRSQRSRSAIFLSELSNALSTGDGTRRRRKLGWAALVVAASAVLGVLIYERSAAERNFRDLVARGEYVRAATLASRELERAPGNTTLRGLATEALLKGETPAWLAAVAAGDFGRAEDILAAMRQRSRSNPEAKPLLDELEWVGALERFVMGRGGVEAPIRMYADEEGIRALIRRWEQDRQEHQRAFATISSHVPQFKETYAEALSHLRKLQSDDLVYVAASERLHETAVAALERDEPQALEGALKEYAEKYPRLVLDDLRHDLRRYTELLAHERARDLAGLTPILANPDFSTPPFKARLEALEGTRRLPPVDVLQQYAAVSSAWRAGDVKAALAGLQAMSAGAWADAVAKQLERKTRTAEQFSRLQTARGARGDDERLLAFYGSLDPYEDAYFVRAAEADLGLDKAKALKRAQTLLTEARASWQEYRQDGPIEGRQRLESAVSPQFRSQAQRLAQAQRQAQEGARIYAQLRVERPAEWTRLQEEIDAEALSQRKSLMELRYVLPAGVYQTKLQLLRGSSDGERESPAAAE